MHIHHDIEFNDPTFDTCECCGARSTNLVRYVYRDNDWVGIYYATFSNSAEHDWVSLFVALGDLRESSPPDQKAAFALRMWLDDQGFSITIVDPQDCPWKTEYFGPVLRREEALGHPWLQEVFDLTDHIATCDQPIIEFLEGSAETPLN